MKIKDNREISIEFSDKEVLDILAEEAALRMHRLGYIEHPNLKAPTNKKLCADYIFYSSTREDEAEIKAPRFLLILSEAKVQEKANETKDLTLDSVQS